MSSKQFCDNCGLEILRNAPYLQIRSTGTVYTNMDVCYPCVSTNANDLLNKQVIPRITNQQMETVFHWFSI